VTAETKPLPPTFDPTAVCGEGRCSCLPTAQGTRSPPRVAFLSCDVAEAVRIALEPAQGKNVEVHSPTIGMSAHRSATGSRP
jgi:hypothetical protein